MSARPNQAEIAWIFDQYADTSGTIAVQHFVPIVEEYRKTLPESTIHKLVEYADRNKDGYITKQELAKLNQEDVETAAKKAGVDAKEIALFKRGVKAAGNLVLTKKEDKEYYYQHYSCIPPPIFMICITMTQFIVYIYYGCVYQEWLSYSPELINSPLIFDPSKREEVWRYLTYMFLHAGLEHVGFNLLTQLVLGIPLEMVHGGLRVAAIYVAGVVGGSLASSVFDPYTPLVGASGGVYALLTAQLANVILNSDVMHRISSLTRTAAVILTLCADFGVSIYRRFQTTFSGARVSFVAHVAGALAGLTMGMIVLHNFKKSLRDKIVFWVAVGVYIAFMIFATAWNIFWPHYA